MKKISILLATSFLTTVAFAQNPVIENADFESGFRIVTATSLLPPASITSNVPNGWFCGDSMVVGLAPQLAIGGLTNLNFEQQCFDVQDFITTGNTGVGIKTAPLNDTLQVPGILSNAKMSVDFVKLMQDQNIMNAITYTGGTATLGKQVDNVKFKAFLDTTNLEVASVTVLAFGKNPANNNAYEVIGSGNYSIEADTLVQDITVTVEYDDTANTATDTMVIVVSSSNTPMNVGNPANYLIVDDFEATYSEGKVGTVGVAPLYTSNDVTVFPIPAQQFINVQLNTFNAASQYEIKMLNIDGRVMQTQAMSNNKTQLDVATVSAGMYQIVLFENGQKVYQQMVSVL